MKTKIVAIAILLSLSGASCSTNNDADLEETVEVSRDAREASDFHQSKVSKAPEISQASPSPIRDSFRDAINQAMAAANSVQTAKNWQDWKGVTAKWEKAIALLETVPQTSPNYQTAVQKIAEYQKNLNYAKQQVSRLDPFNQAMLKAMGAANLTQSAKTYGEWLEISKDWEEAIAMLKLIPDFHEQKTVAIRKIGEYQKNLDYASQQAARLDPYTLAINKANEALQLQKYAGLEADWNEVAKIWEEAIALLQQVPGNHSQKTTANQKINEYSNLANHAKNKASSIRQAHNQALASPQTYSSPSSPSSATTYKTPSTTAVRPQQKTVSTGQSLTDFLTAYLDDAIAGGYGDEYWCSGSESLYSRFYAPRGYRILKAEESGDRAYPKIQLDSSTKGGIPVTNNWTFYLSKESGSWCLNMIMQQ